MVKAASGEAEAAFTEAVSDLKRLFLKEKSAVPEFLAPGGFLTGQAKFTGYGILKDRDCLQHFLELAGRNPDAFTALRYGLAEKLSRKEQLADEERRWLVQFLHGTIKEPPRLGRGTSLFTDFLAYQAVENVQGKYGLKFGRNDASPPLSACDAVAQAMSETGVMSITYSGVRRKHRAMASKLRKLKSPLALFE